MQQKQNNSLFKMGLKNFLKEHNLRFNPRPFSNQENITTPVVNLKADNLVDLHVQVAERVDALIAEMETEKPKTPKPETENNLFQEYEKTVLNPALQEIMDRYSLWLS